MDFNNRYSVYVGSVRGTLTYTDLNPENKIQYDFPEQASEVSSMIWGREDEILVGFKNGLVCTYDTIAKKYVNTINQFQNEGSVVGLGLLNNKILATSSKGNINIMDTKNKTESIMTLSSENGTLETSCQNLNKPNIIATGGEMNDLKLWDVKTKQCVFKAKSMGHDYLNLPIKTSIRGITFIPEEQNLCCCSTKEGHVLLYDDRAQRRPVCKFLEPKASFTCVTTSYRERNVLAGTTKGYIEYVDMKNGKCLKTFTNICGSVTSILCDPIEPVLFTTSLDRFLRIFDLDSKKILHKQYMKQNLNRILVKPIVKEEKDTATNSIEAEVDHEYEEIFKNMEEIVEKPLKRKIKSAKVKSKKLKK